MPTKSIPMGSFNVALRLLGIGRRLRRSPDAQNFFLLFWSGGGARVAQVAAYPLLLWLYTPGDFGLFSVYAAIANIGAAFATLRYEFAIPLPKEQNVAFAVLQLALAGAVTISVAVSLILIVGRDYFFVRAGLGPLAGLGWLAGVAMLGLATYNCLTFWAIRHNAFSDMATTQITKAVAEVGIQAILGFFGAGLLGLILGNIAGMWAGVRRLLKVGEVKLWPIDRRRRLASIAYRYRHFPIYSGTSTLLNEVGGRLIAPVVSVLYAPRYAGLLWVAFIVLDGPASIVFASAQKVYYARARDVWNNSPLRMHRVYFQAVGIATALSIAGGVLAYFAIPFIFEWGLPHKWLGSAVLVQALIPAYVAQVGIMSFVSFNIVERQGWLLAWNAAFFVGNVAALFSAYIFKLDLLTTVILISATRTVMYLATVPVHVHILRPR